MRCANVHFKTQRSSNGQCERVAQSIYLARSLRALAASDTGTVAPHTYVYTRAPSATLLSVELFTSEERGLLRTCLHLEYIGPVYRTWEL